MNGFVYSPEGDNAGDGHSDHSIVKPQSHCTLAGVTIEFVSKLKIKRCQLVSHRESERFMIRDDTTLLKRLSFQQRGILSGLLLIDCVQIDSEDSVKSNPACPGSSSENKPTCSFPTRGTNTSAFFALMGVRCRR